MSAEYEIARAKREVDAAAAVELVFPAFDALPEKKIRVATREFELAGVGYGAGLAEVPQVRQQRGAAQDTADFQINDPKGEIYDSIKAYEDVIEDTQVTIRECLLTSNGTYEAEITHVGSIERLGLSDSSAQLSISAVSDMSRTGKSLGARIIAARYCAAIFNINGLNNPQFDACGWTVDQGGNATFCSHKMDGIDGCRDHNNAWRFLAIEALTTADVTYVQGGGGGGWGYGGGGGGCFVPMTRVEMADGECRPIHKVKKGNKVWCWDEEGNRQIGTVGQNDKYIVDLSMSVDFGYSRNLGVTPEHLHSNGPNTYKCIGVMGVGEALRRWDNGWKDTVFYADELIQRRVRVHNLYIEEEYANYFVVIGEGSHEQRLAVSNAKPVLWDIDPWGG